MSPTALGAVNGPALQEIRGFIFDCDGVLFDSYASNVRYYNAILAHMGLGPMNRDQEQYIHMHAVKDCLQHITPPERRGDLEGARRAVNYFTDILPWLEPEPGLYELLDFLRGHNVPLAISTNRTTTMEAVSRRFDLYMYFFPIMDAAKVKAKPSPEGVHRILEYWGLRPCEAVYIGDSHVDVRTALAAGTPFWAYKNENLLAAKHVSDYWALRRELQHILGPAAARPVRSWPWRAGPLG